MEGNCKNETRGSFVVYRQRFMAAERRLAEMGFSVMNPAWLCAYPAFEREDYLAVSRAMLERCEAVFLLRSFSCRTGEAPRA